MKRSPFFLSVYVLPLLFFPQPVYSDSPAFQQITFTTLCENFQPSMSGNGKRVVFLSDCELIPGSNTDQNYEIFLFDNETKKFLQVTDTIGTGINGQPTVNEDGSSVAFRSSADLVQGSNSDLNSEIFLYDWKTDHLAQITKTLPPSTNSSPNLSSDGNVLVFLSSADLVSGKNPHGVTQLFAFDRKENSFSQLTHFSPSSPVSSSPKGHGRIEGAGLSGDGKKIAVISSVDLLNEEHDGKFPKIYLIHLDQGKLNEMNLPQSLGNYSPAHAPPKLDQTGSLALFLLKREEENDGKILSDELLILREAKNEKWLTVAEATHCRIHDPSISGNGEKIVFGSTCNLVGENQDSGHPNMELFLFDVQGKSLKQLTHTVKDFNHTPSLNSSGSQVAFGSDRDILRGSNLDENSEIFFAHVE